MKIVDGFVCFNGAGDAEDSPVAAALALLFDVPLEVNHHLYFNNYLYQRCDNAKYTVSRDQFIALAAIIYIKERTNPNLKALVDTGRVNGWDIMVSIGSHTSICKGGSPSWIQNKIFKKQLENAAKDKLGEQNQTLIQLMVHPDKSLIKFYCDLNPLWEQAVKDYLCGWRDERDLAETMIAHIYNNYLVPISSYTLQR